MASQPHNGDDIDSCTESSDSVVVITMEMGRQMEEESGSSSSDSSGSSLVNLPLPEIILDDLESRGSSVSQEIEESPTPPSSDPQPQQYETRMEVDNVHDAAMASTIDPNWFLVSDSNSSETRDRSPKPNTEHERPPSANAPIGSVESTHEHVQDTNVVPVGEASSCGATLEVQRQATVVQARPTSVPMLHNQDIMPVSETNEQSGLIPTASSKLESASIESVGMHSTDIAVEGSGNDSVQSLVRALSRQAQDSAEQSRDKNKKRRPVISLSCTLNRQGQPGSPNRHHDGFFQIAENLDYQSIGMSGVIEMIDMFRKHVSQSYFMDFCASTGLIQTSFRHYSGPSNQVARFRRILSLIPTPFTTGMVFHGARHERVAKILSKGLDPSQRKGAVLGAGDFFAKDPGACLRHCHGGKRIVVFLVVVPIPPKNVNIPSSHVLVSCPQHQLPIGYVQFQDSTQQAWARSGRLHLELLKEEVEELERRLQEARTAARIIQRLIQQDISLASEIYEQSKSRLGEASRQEIAENATRMVDQELIECLFPGLVRQVAEAKPTRSPEEDREEFEKLSS